MFAKFGKRTVLLTIACVVAVTLFLWLMPPMSQPQSYHVFADQRTIVGVRNFWDVVSNLPFAIVGLVGLFALRDFASRIIFFGIFATAFGSAYYHLRPDDARLFWDRLPMTIVFMSLFALAIKKRALVIPFVIIGVASIVWWRVTGNLWPYALVQFGPAIPLIVIAVRSGPGLRPVLILYGLSKITEFFDKPIFAVFPLSGHTLKHLLAGAATWYIYRWIQSKQTEPQSSLASAPARI
ncbi:MAG TPA: alkaline phytoceramidase [Candidatus Angelobacter sp.]|nr:alkaline phytoceramidase [Candidatus Angelobacter sp.]